MPLVIGPIFGKYATQTTIYFALEDSSTDTDLFYTGAAPVPATDIFLSIDGIAGVPSTNSPGLTTTGGGAWSLVLTAAEMTGTNITIAIVDATVPQAWKSALIMVKTELAMGTLVVDASQTVSADAISVTAGPTSQGLVVLGGATSGDGAQITAQGGNSQGLTLGGFGTGAALSADTGNITGVLLDMSCDAGQAQGGSPTQIQLAATASALDDYYNGAIVLLIGNTGAGQFNSISNYTGATQLCTMANTWITQPDATTLYVVLPSPSSNFVASSVWNVNEGPEPTGAIPDNATFGSIMQYMKRRFMNKGSQTVAVRTIYKDDSATTLYTQDVSFDGITEVRNKGA